MNGKLWIRPEVKGIAQVGSVATSGRNPVFATNDQYFGVGAEAWLKFFLPRLPIAGNLTVGGGYRYEALYSLPIDRATRWSALAEYSLDDAQHFSVTLKFEDGLNNETFQDEKFWRLGIGVKF